MRRVVCAAVLTAAVAGVGCGAEEASVVERAFDTPIRSAHVDMRLTVTQGGAPAARLTLAGPMKSNGDRKLESFDWRVRLAMPARRPAGGRLISTGDNVFVRYAGRTYEVGERRIARFNRQAAKGEGGEELSRLGLDFKEWFPETAGEPRPGRLDGVATDKVVGRLDVSVVLTQLSAALRRPELRAQGGNLPALGRRDIKAIDALISDPRFELEAGHDDGKLRRVAARFRIRDPRGRGSATVRFELRLTAIDAPVSISGPTSGRPIGQLLRRLGLAGGLDRAEAKKA